MNADKMPDWVAIIISIIALGITLWEKRANQERAERDEYRSLLESFLLPLKTILNRTLTGFTDLTRGHKKEGLHLEYYPHKLRGFFEGLTDERRMFWRLEIAQLQKDNEDAVRLIDQYESRTRLNPLFQESCVKYRKHAVQWKSRWDYVIGDQPTVETDDELAEPFPKGFDQELTKEAKRVAQAARIPIKAL